MSIDYATPLVNFRPKRQPWTKLVVDYNPCFLLSAICMLVGCRILNDTVNYRVGDLSGALWLVLTINVYEFSLLGAATLIKHLQGMRRDVGILLVVGSLFLCDITFIIGDLSTANPWAGIVVAMTLSALAVPKAWIAMWLIESPQRKRLIAMVAAQLAVVILLPVLLKVLSGPHGGRLPLPYIYATWWGVALLPVAGGMILRWGKVRRLPVLAIAYLAAPYVAILGHLMACTWVFKLDFHTACYAPVLLGLAVLAGMMRDRLGRWVAVQAEFILMGVALLMVTGASWTLTGSQTVTPLRLTGLAAAVVNLHGLLATRHLIFAVSLVLMGGALVIGPISRLLVSGGKATGQFLDESVDRLTPRTNAQWGMLAVASSFVLLLVGMAISLWKRPAKE